jgi:hypothetical protein
VSEQAIEDFDLVIPIPRPKAGPFAVKVRPDQQQVALVDNGKPNSMAILRQAQVELRARGVEVKEEIPSKPFAGVPLDEELLSLLSQERGLVLCGVND